VQRAAIREPLWRAQRGQLTKGQAVPLTERPQLTPFGSPRPIAGRTGAIPGR